MVHVVESSILGRGRFKFLTSDSKLVIPQSKEEVIPSTLMARLTETAQLAR